MAKASTMQSFALSLTYEALLKPIGIGVKRIPADLPPPAGYA
jgi:hypothetical protein